MWRREERLADWLSRSRKPIEARQRGFAAELKEKVRDKLRLEVFSATVNSPSMEIHVPTAGLDEAMAVKTEVRDGLAGLNPWPSPSNKAAAEMAALPVGIHGLEVLIGGAEVRNLRLPDERQARIQTWNLLTHPRLRSLAVRGIQSVVHSVECLQNQLPPVRLGNRWIIGKVQIKSLTSKLAGMPYRRMSLEVDGLKESERESFLREAEMQRRIPRERSELLAVFRSVPIEMISRLHFMAGKKMIVYRLTQGTERTQTRVHDMAAVRDRASQETFLIPHRTRFRMVSLLK